MTDQPCPEPRKDIRERFPELYAELKEVAVRILRKKPPQQSILPTDLVHEVFLKMLSEQAARRAQGRSELGAQQDSKFKACFGAACRDVLRDWWRNRSTQKRGGDREQEELVTSIVVPGNRTYGVAELEDALEALAEHDQFCGQLAEFKWFGGLTNGECATELGVSERTVERYWPFARTWLEDRLR